MQRGILRKAQIFSSDDGQESSAAMPDVEIALNQTIRALATILEYAMSMPAAGKRV